MKKLMFFIIFIFLPLFTYAQPVPDCARSSVNNRLFLSGSNELLCDLVTYNARPSYINGCFVIHSYQIKDSLKVNYFKTNIYKSTIDFTDDFIKKKKVHKMEVYFVNIKNKDSFNYYLNIPKFKAGFFLIDVSKRNKTKTVFCDMCRDSIEALDITPKKWNKIKSWKN